MNFEFPLIFPMKVENACKLVFVDTLTVYYSYQHPIAMTDYVTLFVRKDYWLRRRSGRDVHITEILTDAQLMGSNGVQYYDNFFDMLGAALYKAGINFGVQAEVAKSKNKRRVKI